MRSKTITVAEIESAMTHLKSSNCMRLLLSVRSNMCNERVHFSRKVKHSFPIRGKTQTKIVKFPLDELETRE